MIFKSDKKFKLPTYISLNATKKIFIVQYALMETNTYVFKGRSKVKNNRITFPKIENNIGKMFGTLFLKVFI